MYKKVVFAIVFLMSHMSYAQTDFSKGFDSLISRHYPSKDRPGIMVQIYDNTNKVFYSRGEGKADLEKKSAITAQANFRMASVSKQVTAMSIYKLYEQKKLDIYKTRLSSYFPNLKGAIRNSTISQLLNHTSGIVNYEGLIPENQENQLKDKDVLKFIEAVDTVYFVPGSKFRYSNTGYCLLALIVEQVSGQDYSVFVKDQLLEPLKMNHSLVYNPTDSIAERAFGHHLVRGQFFVADQSLTSATKGDGGLYTSANEYMNWNRYLLESMKESTDFRKTFDENLVSIHEGLSYSFGKFKAYDQYGNEVYLHSGESTGFHNFVLSIPKRNINLSVFSNRDDHTIDFYIQDLLDELVIELQGLGETRVFTWLSKVYDNKY